MSMSDELIRTPEHPTESLSTSLLLVIEGQPTRFVYAYPTALLQDKHFTLGARGTIYRV